MRVSERRDDLSCASRCGVWAERACKAVAFVPFSVGLGFIFLGVRLKEILDKRAALAVATVLSGEAAPEGNGGDARAAQ